MKKRGIDIRRNRPYLCTERGPRDIIANPASVALAFPAAATCVLSPRMARTLGRRQDVSPIAKSIAPRGGYRAAAPEWPRNRTNGGVVADELPRQAPNTAQPLGSAPARPCHLSTHFGAQRKFRLYLCIEKKPHYESIDNVNNSESKGK